MPPPVAAWPAPAAGAMPSPGLPAAPPITPWPAAGTGEAPPHPTRDLDAGGTGAMEPYARLPEGGPLPPGTMPADSGRAGAAPPPAQSWPGFGDAERPDLGAFLPATCGAVAGTTGSDLRADAGSPVGLLQAGDAHSPVGQDGPAGLPARGGPAPEPEGSRPEAPPGFASEAAGGAIPWPWGGGGRVDLPPEALGGFPFARPATGGAHGSPGQIRDHAGDGPWQEAAGNQAPVIQGGAARAIAVPENAAGPFHLPHATEPEGAPLAWRIAGGPDAARFAIDAATGALSFRTAPDHEAPRDAGRDNVYDLLVEAADPGGAAALQAIAVTVLDQAVEGVRDLSDPGGWDLLFRM
ncbi:hypothetical protein [Falsiroseomonas sp. CW058]|uniref:cadherin repeat domain-containing protein n=1 Tax=Falsiroseomonas sp. CW058 TaxID=3388664 RepID=UPI003D3227AE